MLNEMNNPESDHPQFNLLFCPELYLTKNYKDLFVTFTRPIVVAPSIETRTKL